jgi:hypothetical protein
MIELDVLYNKERIRIGSPVGRLMSTVQRITPCSAFMLIPSLSTRKDFLNLGLREIIIIRIGWLYPTILGA